VKNFKIKELWIPYYLCDVIRHKLVEISCKPKFYHIDDNFLPSQEFDKEDFILYPNYFGVCDNNVESLTKAYPKLILDNAHSFYSKPKGFACFNSERKFRKVGYGSYLYIKGKEHKEILNKNEYQSEIELRKNQFLIYHKLYGGTNLLKINPACAYSPFCYPYLASTSQIADNLVKDLEKEGKTIYRYWNSLPPTYNEYKFYTRLVPIPLI
jgi:hypothetical protein